MPNHAKKNFRLIALLYFFTLMPGQAWAVIKAHKVNTANELYKDGQYDASVEKYKEALKNDPESDIINFNLGTAYFKQGVYDKAIEHLQKSVLTDDDMLREQAFYNLGDAFYRAGEKFLEQDLNKTIDLYKRSVAEYEKALRINKEDQDAQFNYEFVKKRLEELKKKQQEQQQNQKDQKNDQKKNKDKNQDQQQQPSDQQKNQPNEQQQNDQNKQRKNDQPNNQDRQNQQGNPPAGQNQNQPEQQNQNQEPDQDQSGQKNPEQQNDESSRQNPDGSQKENNDQNTGQPPEMTDQEINAGELTQKEAQMLLQDYQQSIEPKGLLYFNVQTRPAPVQKDW